MIVTETIAGHLTSFVSRFSQSSDSSFNYDVVSMSFWARFKRFGKAANHNRQAYLEYQSRIGDYYLHHFVAPYTTGKRVLDIGCGEGGVLAPFSSAGYECTGLEYSFDRVEFARSKSSSNIKFINDSIEQFTTDQRFDVILMLDVIEHLVNKTAALQNIKRLLAPEGIVVISFPPFRSVFGGHQQVMRSFLKFIPYVHLLPQKIYRLLLQRIEKENFESHWRNYQTGITIKQFEQLIQQVDFKIVKQLNYLVRPRQAFRFGLKIKENRFKLLKEYLTTGVVYILGV